MLALRRRIWYTEQNTKRKIERMNQFKRIISILALICMAVFIVAVILLFAMGKLAEYPVWIYGPMGAFLVFGLLALAIHKIQQLAEEKRREQEKE